MSQTQGPDRKKAFRAFASVAFTVLDAGNSILTLVNTAFEIAPSAEC